jgi:hypothetical protein
MIRFKISKKNINLNLNLTPCDINNNYNKKNNPSNSLGLHSILIVYHTFKLSIFTFFTFFNLIFNI